MNAIHRIAIDNRDTAFKILYTGSIGLVGVRCGPALLETNMKRKQQLLPLLPSRRGGCSSCGLCAAVCPYHAIKMREDSDGFFRPYVDESRCRHCRVCERMCMKAADLPNSGRSSDVEAYAAYATDEKIRLQASSGGVVSLLALRTVQQGGVVYGVKLKDREHAEYVSVENESDLAALSGSKYLPADASVCYGHMDFALRAGRKVFFAGLPCQVKAVRARFGYKYKNLLTADLACYGLPSR